MSSTYLSLHYHLVFSTKHRDPTIAAAWRPRLHGYLGGAVRGVGGIAESVGGIEDHVHLLVGLKATHALADVLREIKKASSAWVHEAIGVSTFAWQDGYAAFTVSPPSREAIKAYIANQEEHHRRRSYRDELIEMLERAGVAFDPRYLN
jgi:putative transposase